MITGNGDENHSSEECQSMEVEIDNDTFGVIITALMKIGDGKFKQC